jgi:glycosyltransferase involved in cell wall biosynthesis
VLFVSHTGVVGGAERSLLSLLGALPAGMIAGLACPAGPLAEAARELDIDVHSVRGTSGSLRLHPRHTPLAVGEIGLSAVQVARVARRTGAAVVHANSLRAGFLAGIACRIDRRGLVVHVRDCLPDSAVSRAARRVIAREADVLVAISRYVADRFTAGLAAREPPVRVIDNPVDLRRFRPPARGATGSGDGLLVVVGQITPWKGQDTAIRALHDVRRSRPAARLWIVGDVKFDGASTRFDNRAYLEQLHRLVSELGLAEAVEFTGERGDVAEIMARADVVLAPSHEEPFGRAVAEAMAVGAPVVATSVGGPAELIDDRVTGLLVDPRAPSAWSEAVGRLLDAPAWARAMGRRASEVAHARFAVDRHARAMIETFDGARSAARASLGG